MGDILILEGPDGVGKTSLAMKIAEMYGFVYLRCPGSSPVGEALRPILKSGGKDGEMDELTRTMLFAAVDHETHCKALAMATGGMNVVMDRCGLSNLVYRKVCGEERGAKWVNANLEMLLPNVGRFDGEVGGTLVVLDAEDAVLRERSSRGDDDRYDRLSEAVRNEYRQLVLDEDLLGELEKVSGVRIEEGWVSAQETVSEMAEWIVNELM